MKTSKKKQSAADLMAHKLALLMCLPNSSFDKCKRCQLFPDCEKERLKEKNFKPKISDCEKKIKQYYKEKADIQDGWDVVKRFYEQMFILSQKNDVYFNANRWQLYEMFEELKNVGIEVDNPDFLDNMWKEAEEDEKKEWEELGLSDGWDTVKEINEYIESGKSYMDADCCSSDELSVVKDFIEKKIDAYEKVIRGISE